MAKLKRGKSKRLVLDLGSSAVRLCELTPTKAGYQLTKYYHREFPIDPSMDDDAQREARKTTILALLKDAKVRSKRTIFGVPGQSVFTRTRTLPPVPEYKVNQIVRYEIQQQIPFQLDQIAYDYQVLQRTEAGGYDVLMAAIKVDVVEKRLETIKDIKRRVDTVDVNPLAAYNWLKFTKEFGEAGECIALVDLGAATTDIVIERDNQFRFTRSLNLGGNDITSAVAAEFNMPWAQAEKLKRERGFAPTGDPARDGKGGEVIGRVLNRLVSEINRSFAYFRSQPGGGPVSRIIVTGGGACLRNMVPYLQRQLGIEVRIAQPLAGLAIAPGAQEVNEHPEQAATVLGLALRCCEQVAIGINLIPPRILESARRREAGVYWLLSVATLVLIMLTIVPAMAQQSKIIEGQIEIAKREIGQFDPALPYLPGPPTGWNSEYENAIKNALAKINGFKSKIDQLDSKLDSRHQWINDLITINDARPRGKLVLIYRLETTFITPPGAAPGPTHGGSLAAAPRPQQDDDDGRSTLSRLAASRRTEDNSRGMGLRMGGASRRTTDIGGQADKWGSTGFEGIESERGGAAMREDGVGQAGAETPVPMVYNGLTIAGYAQDTTAVEEFKQNLEDSGRYVIDGKPAVYFDERYSDPKPFTDLDNAGAGVSEFGGIGGGIEAGGRDGGRLRNLAQSNASNSYYGGTTETQWNAWGTVVSFRIDVQFSNKVVIPQGANTTQMKGSTRTKSLSSIDRRHKDRLKRR